MPSALASELSWCASHCIYPLNCTYNVTPYFQDSGMSSLNGSGDATSTAVAVPEGKSADLSALADEAEQSPELACVQIDGHPPH